jgi:uncharacterized protein YbaR (Trm112 family)
MAVDKELLDLLVCPKCKGELRLKDDKSGLICEGCRLLYRIEDDIPVMLIDEAVDLDSSAGGA